jgi:hypothetical protein
MLNSFQHPASSRSPACRLRVECIPSTAGRPWNFLREGAKAQRRDVEKGALYVAPLRLCAFSLKIGAEAPGDGRKRRSNSLTSEQATG